MKNTAILLMILFGVFVSGCKDHSLEPHPEVDLVIKAGGLNDDAGRSIAIDKSGNVYVAGEFTGTATFGTTTLTTGSVFGFNMFIAKYSSNGELLWVKQASGSNSSSGNSLAVDDSGNLFITGYFGGTIYLGGIALTSNGFEDAFIAKYSSNGDVLWAQSFGSEKWNDYGKGIAVDESGNVYLTGNFVDRATIGTTTLTSTSTDLSWSNVFVAKFTNGGTFQWVKQIGGRGNKSGEGIAVDKKGNVHVAGFFDYSADFGSVTLNADNGGDTFLAKYNSNGDVLWVREVEGVHSEQGHSVAVDMYDNVYLVGEFYSTLVLETTTLTSRGQSDVFISKFNSSGEVQWIRQEGGLDGELGRGITVGHDSNIYVVWSSLGSFSFGNSTVTNNGNSDIFTSKYNSMGELQWIQQAGGTNYDSPFGIATDGKGKIAITGYFTDTALFGTTTLTSSGLRDVFVASYQDY